MNDVNATYKGSVFLYDDADGQPMTMNSGGTNSALGRVTDVVPAAESEDDLVKQKLKKFKVNIQSILEVSANCMQASNKCSNSMQYITCKSRCSFKL